MIVLIIFFIALTFGLAMRWYISGHAPWSDGYESMIYISWATMLAGFIFSKNSPITLAATGILTGLILFVAHLNWMDPQVTNLVPVLNSYWLSIHVSMITASYGFLGLGALLGFITLILFMVKNDKNSAAICSSIAAKIHSLPIHFEKIEDNLANQTRFLILSDFKNAKSEADKSINSKIIFFICSPIVLEFMYLQTIRSNARKLLYNYNNNI